MGNSFIAKVKYKCTKNQDIFRTKNQKKIRTRKMRKKNELIGILKNNFLEIEIIVMGMNCWVEYDLNISLKRKKNEPLNKIRHN